MKKSSEIQKIRDTKILLSNQNWEEEVSMQKIDLNLLRSGKLNLKLIQDYDSGFTQTLSFIENKLKQQYGYTDAILGKIRSLLFQEKYNTMEYAQHYEIIPDESIHFGGKLHAIKGLIRGSIARHWTLTEIYEAIESVHMPMTHDEQTYVAQLIHNIVTIKNLSSK